MMSNQTWNSEICLVGFPGIIEDYNGLIATTMSLIYMTSITANGSVVFLVTLNLHLHKPMYLIIANLAASSVLFDTVTLPKLIAKYWFGASYMSFKACVFQMFFVHYFGSLDSFLLMVMAADRYVSIYWPLRYPTIVTNKVVAVTCGFCWLFLATSINVAIAIQNSLIVPCVPYKIHSLFCTQSTIASLACTDVTYIRQVAFVCAMTVLLVPLGVILLSYILIIAMISFRHENWRKAFYTCTTHLLVVGLYYGPRIFTYIIIKIPIVTITPELNVLLLFLFSFVPHLANPIIYFLKTKEIKETLGKVINRIKNRIDNLST